MLNLKKNRNDADKKAFWIWIACAAAVLIVILSAPRIEEIYEIRSDTKSIQENHDPVFLRYKRTLYKAP